MVRPRKDPSKNSKITKKTESQRVAAWRKRLMQEEHFRSVSFLVSPEEFSRIEAARSRTGMNSKELMLAQLDLIAPEPEADELIDPDDQGLAETERVYDPAPELLARGELYHLPGRQAYVLMALFLNLERLPGLFPFDTELIRDFGQYREALQYYCLRRDRLPPARQLLLLGPLREDEIAGLAGREKGGDYYRVRLRLNEIYPQLSEYADGIDYRGAYRQMAAEYADEL